jgi:hypothetical protein
MRTIKPSKTVYAVFFLTIALISCGKESVSELANQLIKEI